jgi:hypothetical protein
MEAMALRREIAQGRRFLRRSDRAKVRGAAEA